MLDVEELINLENLIRDELDNNLTTVLTKLNRCGQLEEFLRLLDMEYLLNNDGGYHTFKNGKIIVIGQSNVKANVILKIAQELGIDKNRFELYLNYDSAEKFRFQKIQWQPHYSLVMVGPMPHSITGKGNYSSMISALESEEGYPPVIRLGENDLKISKNNLRSTLEKMIKSNIIKADTI